MQPAALRVTFTGDGGHAGGQLMAVRNDAGLAAAELSLHVETATLATGARTVWRTQPLQRKEQVLHSPAQVARLQSADRVEL